MSDLNVDASPSSSGYESSADPLVTIPADSESAITVAGLDNSSELSIDVYLDPTVDTEASMADDGTIVYNGKSVSQTVQPTTDGVRINTVINSSGSPEDYRHRIELSDGLRLITAQELQNLLDIDQDDSRPNAIYVVNDDDEIVGGVAAPWAYDSTGKRIETSFSLEGNTLIQHVRHRSAQVSYPIVADPWIGKSLIASAKWVNRSEGRTLMVSPTGWARFNGGDYLVGNAGWNELYSKYKTKGLTKNLGGMKDQFICHQEFAFLKSTWNLDEWRPDVSYAQTVNSKCNPGGGKIID